LIAPTPLPALFARAARLYARRWPLYVLCAIVAFAVQIGIDLTHALRPPVLEVLGQMLALPALVAIAYGFVNADSSGESTPDSGVWERIGERFWAVFVIDAISTLFNLANPGTTSLLLSVLFLTGILVLTALLIYADVYAVIEPGVAATTIVQQSIMASARTAMTRLGYSRAIILVFLQIATAWAASLADGGVGNHVPGLPTFASTAIISLLAGPFAALTLVVYLDLRLQK
jgi:hypothetical protein